MEYNLKKRKLYCPKCKTTIVSDQADVRCDECNSKLITVIFDELDTRPNQST